MSMMPMVSSQQAAELLGVSDSRVRQMVAEGRLIPVPFGKRMQVFYRSEIRAYLRRTSSSQVLRSLPPAEAPLRLSTDAVWFHSTSFTGQPLPVHVRIYRGEVQGHLRTVVLLSEPVGTQGVRVLINRAESIIAAVAERFLDGQVAEVTWVDVWPPHGWGSHSPWQTGVGLRNIVVQRDGGDRWGSPSWTPVTIAELDSALGGGTVDWYEWGSYTPELVAQWQRTGRPVEVIDDPDEMQPLVQALETLTRTTHPTRQIAREALLVPLALRRSHQQLRQLRKNSEWWDDLLLDDTVERPDVTTSARVPFRLPPQVVSQLPDIEDLGGTLEDRAEECQALQSWLREVDEFADSPQPELVPALELALKAVATYVRLTAPDTEMSVLAEPVAHPRGFPVRTTPWDEQYLERVTWLEGDPRDTASSIDTRRDARQLAQGYEKYSLRFGHDLLGALVVIADQGEIRTGESFQTLRVMWPTVYEAFPLPNGVHLVADGDGGDLPVYLARHGTIIGLLPHPGSYEQWNFGYDGGGPGQLAADVRSFLIEAGQDLIDEVSPAIEKAIYTSSKKSLDLDLDAIIGPLGPNWWTD